MLVIRQAQLDALAAARPRMLVSDLVRRAQREFPALQSIDRETLFARAARGLELAPAYGFIVLEHQVRFAELYLAAKDDALETADALALLGDDAMPGGERLERLGMLVMER